MVCTFFGHKDTPDSVKPLLENAIREIIQDNENVTFYVGTHGKKIINLYDNSNLL